MHGLDVCVRIVHVCGVRGCDVGARQGPAERHGFVEAVHGVGAGRRSVVPQCGVEVCVGAWAGAASGGSFGAFAPVAI